MVFKMFPLIRMRVCRSGEDAAPPFAGGQRRNAMNLAIIQAAIMAALFLIAAAVSYHSGYVGGRVDGAMETEVAE